MFFGKKETECFKSRGFRALKFNVMGNLRISRIDQMIDGTILFGGVRHQL